MQIACWVLLTLARAPATAPAPPSVSDGPAFNASGPHRGIVYGQGLVFAGDAAQQRAVNLTLDAFVPASLGFAELRLGEARDTRLIRKREIRLRQTMRRLEPRGLTKPDPQCGPWSRS